MTLLVVEGYKMAEGTATVQFLNQPPRKINGVFLYRPDTDMWHLAPTPEFPWGATFSKNELISIDEGSRKND